MLTAMLSTLAAWVAGLLLDANLPFEPTGFLCLRAVLPVIVMGAFVLAAVQKRNGNGETTEKENGK